jgi:hypothetical protein
LQQGFPDVVFAKLDVDENEETAEACGIQAGPPIFQIYQSSSMVYQSSQDFEAQDFVELSVSSVPLQNFLELDFPRSF